MRKKNSNWEIVCEGNKTNQKRKSKKLNSS